jgi:hypothetical protein
MALQTCPDCQHKVSESALACPQCGRALVLGPEFCPYCKQPTAKKVQGVFGLEGVITILLLCLGIIPGAIYYFDVTRYPYCTACDRRIRKRVDTRGPGTAPPSTSRCEECMKPLNHKHAAEGESCWNCKHVQSWATVEDGRVTGADDLPLAEAKASPAVEANDPPPEVREGLGNATRIDDLVKLDALRQSGALTQEEFDAEKAKLLS